MNVMSVVEELLCLSVLYLFVCLFFWWLLLPSRLLSLPSSTTSQTPPPRSILRTTRHLWEIKHSHFGSRVLQQKSFVLQFWPKSPVVVACLLIPLFFFFLVASVSLPTPFTSLHHNLADWHLPSSHHPPHHTSSLRNQTLPFRKPGFATEDLRLAILSEMCLPVVVCWQDCSSCLLRKCCVCLFCISYFWPNSNAAKPSQNIQKHRNS